MAAANCDGRVCCLRDCGYVEEKIPIGSFLRGGASDDQIADLVRDCIRAKAPAHGIGSADFVRPERAMYQIGG